MLNNKKGIAFFLVFVLIGFTIAIIMALGIQVQNQARVTKSMKEKEIAFLIAQAGLKAVYYEEQKTNWSWFTHKPDDAQDGYELPDTAPNPMILLEGEQLDSGPPWIDGALPDGSYEDGASGNYAYDIMGGHFEVTAKQDLNDVEIITIESTGTYGSQSVTLSSTYYRTLFNKYFIFTPFTAGRTSHNWNYNAGRGKMYIGQNLLISSSGLYQGNIFGTGSISVLGKIIEWTWEDNDFSADIEYRLAILGHPQKEIRRFFLGLDGTPPYGNVNPTPFPSPGLPYGEVFINGVPIRTDPLMKGACSDMSDYIWPAWLDETSPYANETYRDILAYDDGFDLDDSSDDVLIPVIPGQLPATILNNWNERISDRETAWNNFMADYVTPARNNIFVEWSGTTTETRPHLVDSPNYDVLADSAIMHIVDPNDNLIDDPDDDIVSDRIDIPGCVAIINFYDPALCYQEDNWLGYSQEIRDAYEAAHPEVDTTDPVWRSHHDGSIVGSSIRAVVIDVAKMVDDAEPLCIPDKAVLHSEVPVILLGTPNVAKTFTFICDDNLYLQGDFNNIESKSITLMSRTQGFYESDTFIVSKDPFQINSFYAGAALGVYLGLWPDPPPPDLPLPLDKKIRFFIPRYDGTHIDSLPMAVPTTQHALFIGLWNRTVEDWCTGSTPLTQNGSLITLPQIEVYPSAYSHQRFASNEYGVLGQFLYTGGCINLTQGYDDRFYDNPAAGHIAGNQLLEWRIIR